MLRFLYILCDLLAAVSALLSPIAMVHWLLRITHVAAAAPFINLFSPIFDPLNSFLELIIPVPSLNYAGNAYSTTQGIVGCLFTGLFFLLNLASESLKAAEQRADISQHAISQRRRLQKLRDEQQTTQRQVTGNCTLYVQVSYDSHACLTGASYLETAFVKNGGKMLHGSANSLSLTFDSVAPALKYCMDASQALLSYYATLRPIDPQPPFQIAVHALDAQRPPEEGLAAAQRLVTYGGPNQVLFSQDVKTLLETTDGLSALYRYQSVGLYAIAGTQPVELFRLFFTKSSSSPL